MNPQTEPTPNELAAMAYFDGQLEGEERRRFEQQLRSDPGLAREVAAYRSLDFALHSAAPPEPIDAEWDRQRRDPLQRFLLGLATLVGAIGLGLWLCSLGAAPFGVRTLGAPSLGPLLMLASGLVLLGRGVRGRLRELPFDPYVSVKR